jgi:hypothetical protein
MTKTQEQIIEQAMALPPEARAEVVDKLLARIEEEDWAEIDPALAEEAERRIDALDRGEDRTYPAAEVIKELMARVKK